MNNVQNNFNLLTGKTDWEIIAIMNFYDCHNIIPLYIALKKSFEVLFKEWHTKKIYYTITLYPITTYMEFPTQRIEKNFLTKSSSENGKFEIEVNLREKIVKFAARQDFMIWPIELRNRGLGTYILSELIRWSQSHFSEYEVMSLLLGPADARTEDAKNLRNAFYRKFGFELKFRDKDIEGRAYAKRLADLKIPEINADKIRVIDIKEFVNSVIEENINLYNEVADLKNRNKGQAEIIDELRKLRDNLLLSRLIVIIIAVGIIILISK